MAKEMRLKINRAKFPCRGCEDREIGCHSKCERYLAAKDEAEKNRLEHIEESERNWEVNSYIAHSRDEIRKHTKQSKVRKHTSRRYR